MHLHNYRCFQKHLRMLLQSLRVLCKAPGGPGSIWKHSEALERATRVSGRFVCAFQTDLHLADAAKPDARLPAKPVSPQPVRVDPPLQLAPSKATLSEVMVSTSERWDETCQSCGGKVRSKPCCQLIANPDSVLPQKAYPQLPSCSQPSQMHSFSPAHSKSRFSATSKATSTPTSILVISSDQPLLGKADPRLPACSQRSQFHPYQGSLSHYYQPAPSEAILSERWEWAFHHYQLAPNEARLPERWDWTFHCYQFAPSKARSTPTSLLPAKPERQRGESEHSVPTSLLPVKSDCQKGESEHSATTSLLPALLECLRAESEHVRAVRPSMSELSKWVSKANSTPTSVLPVSPDPLLQAKPDSPLLAKAVPPLPAKPDRLLPACSQWGQFHPYQRSWIHHSKWGQFHPDRWSWTHCY